jgi:hypothetical protein
VKIPASLLRFAVEAAFLVAVAVAVAVARLSAFEIVLVMAAAWLLVAFVERTASRGRLGFLRRRRPAQPAVEPAAPEAEAEELEASIEPPPSPVRVLPDEPEPQPEPEPPPVPAAPPRVPPAPRSEPDGVVSFGSRGNGPRQWNLWDLERMAREREGVDTARDEERNVLLMELRQFASPDGLLPDSFDGIVRESFGELIARGNR